jgi:UV DNA damage endonuclease
MNLSDCTTDASGKIIKVSAKNKIFTSRTLRMKSFSLDKASQLALQNVLDLVTIMKWNATNNIHFFRISSNMFPFIDHPKLTYNIEDLPDSKHIIQAIQDAGSIAKQNNIRLTSHPGPYTCLASPHDLISSKSILSIEKHTDVAKILNTKDFNINIHIGGNYDGSYDNTAKRFCSSFKKLSQDAQELLTVENDDKPKMWNVNKLYQNIYSRIGIPIVMDIHHWQFNNEMPIEISAKIALSTWGSKIPKMHYSESKPNGRPQAHSDYIYFEIPQFDFNIKYDVMIEAKQKEKALIKYRQYFNLLKKSSAFRQGLGALK